MIKLGIIGCGYWGPNLIRNFNKVKGCEVAWCADLDGERLQHIAKLYPKMKTTKSYKDMLNDGSVEGVIVATPIQTHYLIGKEALEAGKHVLIEKPITSSSKDATKLIETAKAKRKVLMVDHTFEYSPAVQKIKDIIKKKELGDILTIDMVRVNLGLFQEKVNVVWDLAPHDLSMLLSFVDDRPVSVQAAGMAYVRQGIEDDAHITIVFGGGITAHLHLSWLFPKKVRQVTIVGNKKMLVYDDAADDGKIKVFDKGVMIEKTNIPIQPHYDTYEQWKLTYRSGETTPVPVEKTEPLFLMASHFCDCIKEGKTPLTGGHSGLKVVKIVEAVQESLKNDNKKVVVAQ
jgi:predicted dehydrogenase